MASGTWADRTDRGEEEEEKFASQRVTKYINGPDRDGIKTITTISVEDGKTVTTIKKIRETKKAVQMTKMAAERKKWKKFGACKNAGAGPEANVTYSSREVINLQLKCHKREDDENEENEMNNKALKKSLGGKDGLVKCSNCGEMGHWSVKCPKRRDIEVLAKSRPNEDRGMDRGMDEGARAPGAYQAYKGSEAGDSKYQDDSSFQIRVTNIPEETTENDLRDMFKRFGDTKRIYLAKSRGFAFITYTNRSDAQMAIDKTNGHGYGNLILTVEFAKPKEEAERPSAGSTGAGQAGWTMRGTK